MVSNPGRPLNKGLSFCIAMIGCSEVSSSTFFITVFKAVSRSTALGCLTSFLFFCGISSDSASDSALDSASELSIDTSSNTSSSLESSLEYTQQSIGFPVFGSSVLSTSKVNFTGAQGCGLCISRANFSRFLDIRFAKSSASCSSIVSTDSAACCIGVIFFKFSGSS